MNSQETLQIVDGLLEAINSGRTDDALLFCDLDVTITEPDGGTVNGRAACHSLLTKMVSLHAYLQLTHPEVQGETVTGIILIANDYHRKVGIAPLELTWRAVIRKEKILAFGGTFTEAALEKLRPLRERAALQAQKSATRVEHQSNLGETHQLVAGRFP